MSYRTTLIHGDGTLTTHVSQRKPSLDVLQQYVGGSIEHVPTFDRYEGRAATVWVNEDGIARGLPHNRLATELWIQCLGEAPLRYTPALFGCVAIVQRSLK
jgi:hypothetical protein